MNAATRRGRPRIKRSVRACAMPARRLLFVLSIAVVLFAGVLTSRHPAAISPEDHAGVAAELPTEEVAADDAVDASGSPVAQPTIERSWARELRALRELAATDADAAFARIAAMTDKHERRAAAVHICREVAAIDPAKAMDAAWTLGLGRFSDEESEYGALEYVAQRWAGSDPARALAWAGTLPADEESRRDRVVRGIAAAIAADAPDVAARLVTDGMASGSWVQLDAVLDVLRVWAAQDRTSAIAWVALFPDGPFRARGVEVLAATEIVSND